MANKETIDSQEQVEEGMGDVIRLGALLALLAVPGVSSAKEISNNLPKKDKIEAADISKAMDDAAPKKTYSGYSIQQAANIVARTLYDEARGEGETGIDAVASVILNRAGGKAEKLPTVCLKKFQFSGWNERKNLDPKNYKILIPSKARKPGKDRDMWLYCQKTAGKLIFGEFKSTIGKLNSYYAHDKVTPDWADSLKDVKVVGNHTFGYLSDQDGSKVRSNIYKIKTGDNLSKIAKAKNTTVDEILKLNPKIKNPNKISIGMKIKLPS